MNIAQKHRNPDCARPKGANDLNARRDGAVKPQEHENLGQLRLLLAVHLCRTKPMYVIHTIQWLATKYFRKQMILFQHTSITVYSDNHQTRLVPPDQMYTPQTTASETNKKHCHSVQNKIQSLCKEIINYSYRTS